MRPSRRRPFAVTLLATCLCAAALGAQAPTGRITGVVHDARGVPLASASVGVRNTATGARRSTFTAADGSFGVTGLVPGAYSVSATRIGHRMVSKSVTLATEARVDLELPPAPLQAVLVTATLREQELQDVPFSIAAPTANALRERGADNIEAVAANVAGFSVQNLGPGQSQVAMRGASSGQIARDQPGVKEQVGAYLDDSPISLSLFTPDLDLFDVSRIEVLRGPQGTLFGAGSVAGTVRYITTQPQLGVSSTFGEVSGSQISDGSAGGTVKLGANVPFGDRAAGRVAVYHNQLGGYMDAVHPDLSVSSNINTGRRTGGRAALRFAPTDRVSITPRVVFQSVRMDGWNRIDAYNILANPYTTSRPKVSLGDRQLFTEMPEPFSDDFLLSDVNMQYDLGKARLTSVTSYGHRDILVVRDGGALFASIVGGSMGFPEPVYTLDARLDDKTKVNTFTQEVRLAGSTDRTSWLVGGFASKARRDYGQSVKAPGFEGMTHIPTAGLRAAKDELFFSDLSYDLSQVAFFGEGTLNVTDRLGLTAGLRWYDFNEDRDQVFDGMMGNDNNGTSVVSVPGSTSANGFAPRFIATMRANDRITLNAQASRGVRLGGINDPLNVPICTAQDLQTFSGRDSWTDETAWNYEVGAKTRWFGGRASFDVSAFRMNIEDLQLVVTAGSCTSRLVFNVPKAVSQGLELEFNAAPNEHVDFAFSASLNDSKLRSTLTSTDASGHVSVVSGIQSGNRLPSVPQVQVASALTLRRPLRPGVQGFVNGTFQHVGSRYTQVDDHAAGFGTVNLNAFAPHTIGGPLTQSTFTFNPLLPAYQLMNLRLGVTRATWETAFFVNNLTNERALLALDRERGTLARVGYLTNQPRTVGVGMRFGY